jgi:hypothetical protein
MVAMMKARRKVTEACLGKVETRIETGHEQIDTEINAGLEEVEVMDFEENPEETESIVEQQEIPKEEA